MLFKINFVENAIKMFHIVHKFPIQLILTLLFITTTGSAISFFIIYNINEGKDFLFKLPSQGSKNKALTCMSPMYC